MHAGSAVFSLHGAGFLLHDTGLFLHGTGFFLHDAGFVFVNTIQYKPIFYTIKPTTQFNTNKSSILYQTNNTIQYTQILYTISNQQYNSI